MNHSGDVAEQMVRLSLEGVEVAAKITGAAAKEIAVFLIAAMKNNDKNLKLKGKARLNSMLKSGRALEIFSVRESDLKSFMQGAKQYGIVYCVLRNTKNNPDGLCDIMVKADDAPKISRLIERLNLATVDKAKIESDVVAEKTDKTAGAGQPNPNVDSNESLLDELLGTAESKQDQKNPGKEQVDSHPLANGGVPPKSRPSEPTSESRSKFVRDITNKPSVKEEINEIITAQANKSVLHKQTQINSKLKFRKSKERF